MKKLLLFLLAVAGAWTSAFALDGYVTHTQDVTMTLNRADLNHVTNNQFVYTNGNYGTFTLSGDANIDYLSGNDKCLDLNKGSQFYFSWADNNTIYSISKVTSFTIKTASYKWTNAYVSLNNGSNVQIQTSSTDKTKDSSYKTVSTSNDNGLPNNLSIKYSSLNFNQYICYISCDYQVEYYTLDFTKANILMTQAEALYNNLSEESKASAEGQALIGAKNTTSSFKGVHENEAVDVNNNTLRSTLTSYENAIQAAIDAFTCNLADTDEYTVPGKTVTNITLTRAIKANTWNTLCLPFDMEIPAGWTVKELSGVTYNSVADSYDAQFSTAASIVAGKPYIVKVSTEVPEITRNDAAGFKLAAAPTPVEVSDNDGTLTFTGVFAPQNLANCYFISGGKFYYATPGKGNTTKAYRALFTIGGASSSAKLVYTVDGDEVTLIDAPELESDNNAPIYDLQGRRVNAPVSGKVYVKNGKKFVQQ